MRQLRKGMSDKELLGDQALRAVNDFDKSIVERNTRIHLDWSRRWHCPLDLIQKQIIAEHQTYLNTLMRTSVIASERLHTTTDASNATLEQLLAMQQQSKRLLSVLSDTDPDRLSYSKRLAGVIYQVRRSMYYALCKHEPMYFAALTEICNVDTGPISASLSSTMEDLTLNKYRGSSVVIDQDRYQILITREGRNTLFELMATVTRRTPGTDAAPEPIKLIQITGRFNDSNRLCDFSSKTCDYHIKIWSDFVMRVDTQHRAWSGLPNISGTLTSSERQAVLRRCSGMHLSDSVSLEEAKPAPASPRRLHASLWGNPLSASAHTAATDEVKPATGLRPAH